VASGFDGAAIVNVNTRLAGATTQANLDVVTCDPSGCTSGPPVALSVAWTGQGPTQPFRFHSQFAADGSYANTVGTGQVRDADAAGLVDGSPYTNFPGSPRLIQTVAIKSNAK
jgi:hypothetical protein